MKHVLTCRRYDGDFWDYISRNLLHERVCRYLLDARFYGIYAAGHTTLDHAMITTLVERWRPETHTFYLNFEEVTITLQDVAILYGLPVDGLPMMEIDLTLDPADWQTRMVDLLGWAPIDIDREFKGGNKVKVMYLHLLTDLFKVGQYAWGAATLAILYRYLCRASQKGIRVIGGFLPLLQIWIYERILPLRPQRDPDLLVDE
ncbi:hypothetical protein P3S67_001892 [Capsicum chacoense]